MGAMSSEGALRAATAAMWTNGGFAVQLRTPGLAVSGSDAEQLGLASPQFQDLYLAPAVWRRFGQVKELLVSAQEVTSLMGEQNVGSAQQLFETAVGVVAQGVLYQVTGCVPMVAGTTAIAYRLAVQAPAWT